MERLTDEQREAAAALAWVGRMYAARFVRRHGLRGAMCDSVESAAGWAVLIAVRRYCPDRHGASVRDYAVRVVPGMLVEALRLEHGRAGKARRLLAERTGPLSVTLENLGDWGGSLTVDRGNGGEWPAFEAVDAADELRALPVSPKALAMSLHYIGEGRPAPEVARMFGLSESGVRMAWADLKRRAVASKGGDR